MRGFSVSRAVRYQWATAVAVLLCAVLFGQCIKRSVIARIFLFNSQTIAKTIAPFLPSTLATRLLIAPARSLAGVDIAVDTPLLSLGSENAPGGSNFVRQPHGDSELVRWKARRQYLETQIADAKQLLAGLPDGEPLPLTVGTKLPARSASLSRGASAEEISLRKQVDETKARLDLLRITDTDLHPDVIEAREALGKAQGQLDAIQRRAEAAMPIVQLPPPLQEPVVEPANVSSQRSNAMQQIANLIHAEARVDDRIKEAESLSTPVSEDRESVELSEAYKFPPLDKTSETLSTNHAPAPVELSMTAKTAGYELCCIAISLAFAVVAACLVEIWQDHLPGADALHTLLPERATFLGTVPRMRKS